MLSKATNRLSQSLYVFARKPALSAATFLPLYQSSVFKSKHRPTQPTTLMRFSRKASLLSGTSSCCPPSSSAYLPLHAAKRILSAKVPLHFARLRPRKRGHAHRHSQSCRLPDTGVLHQPAHSLELPRYSSNHSDMLAQSKLPEPRLAPFVDDEMVYFNVAAKETLFCERDGEWNQETVSHEKLSVETRLNEKEWFDRQNIF